MNTHADKTQENKTRSVSSGESLMQSGGESSLQFVDNRPEAIAQRKLQEMTNNSAQAKQAAQLQKMADNNSAQQQLIQKKENSTGLPDNLKTRMENLSGMSLDDVKVHRNSDKPAQLQAHAYAQGTDIHLEPGQEKHLPHESWHVVQQKQGRVKPTMQMKGKVNANDDAGLEKEAGDHRANEPSPLRALSSLVSSVLSERPAGKTAGPYSEPLENAASAGPVANEVKNHTVQRYILYDAATIDELAQTSNRGDKKKLNYLKNLILEYEAKEQGGKETSQELIKLEDAVTNYIKKLKGRTKKATEQRRQQKLAVVEQIASQIKALKGGNRREPKLTKKYMPTELKYKDKYDAFVEKGTKKFHSVEKVAPKSEDKPRKYEYDEYHKTTVKPVRTGTGKPEAYDVRTFGRGSSFDNRVSVDGKISANRNFKGRDDKVSSSEIMNHQVEVVKALHQRRGKGEVKDIAKIARKDIINADTLVVMSQAVMKEEEYNKALDIKGDKELADKAVVARLGRQLRESNATKEHTKGDPGLYALLGTPNGVGVFFLVRQRMPGKEVISVNQLADNLEFHIEDESKEGGRIVVPRL